MSTRSKRERLALVAGVLRRAVFIAGAAGLVAGCTVEATPATVVVPAGRLILDWTIDEGTNPNSCTLGGADTFEIEVTTPGGAHVGTFQAPCAAFATTISQLNPGTYTADALLLGPSGTRTTAVPIDPFTISSSDVVIPIDFPVGSFF